MTVNLCDERTLHSNFHACDGMISAKLCDHCAYEFIHMNVDGDLNRNCWYLRIREFILLVLLFDLFQIL